MVLFDCFGEAVELPDADVAGEDYVVLVDEDEEWNVVDGELAEVVCVPTVGIVVDVDGEDLCVFAGEGLLSDGLLLLAAVAPGGGKEDEGCALGVAGLGELTAFFLRVEVGEVGHLASFGHGGCFAQPATEECVVVGVAALVGDLGDELAEEGFVDGGHLLVEDEGEVDGGGVLFGVLAEEGVGVGRIAVAFQEVAVFAVGTGIFDERGLGAGGVEGDADFGVLEEEVERGAHGGVGEGGEDGAVDLAREEEESFVGFAVGGVEDGVAIEDGEGEVAGEAALAADFIALGHGGLGKG